MIAQRFYIVHNIEIHYESMSDKTKLLPKGLFNPLCLAPNHMSIRMSHWRHTMVDGAEFRISYQRLAISVNLVSDNWFKI